MGEFKKIQHSAIFPNFSRLFIFENFPKPSIIQIQPSCFLDTYTDLFLNLPQCRELATPFTSRTATTRPQGSFMCMNPVGRRAKEWEEYQPSATRQGRGQWGTQSLHVPAAPCFSWTTTSTAWPTPANSRAAPSPPNASLGD